MNIFSAAALLGASTAVKMVAGLATIKALSHFLGVEGLGHLGQVMGLVAITTLLAGGGTYVGLTKYIAEHHDDPVSRWAYLRAAMQIWGAFSLGLLLLAWLTASSVSRWLFDTDAHAWYIVCIGLVHPLIGLHNLALAVISGLKKVATYAWVTAATTAFGALVTIVLTLRCGVSGAAVGLILTPGLGILFSGAIVWRRRYLGLPSRPVTSTRQHHLALLKYGAMYFVSALAMPLAQIMLRNTQAAALGWAQVGIWQGLLKLSDAYLQVVMAVLAVHYMPRLAELKQKEHIRREVFHTFKIVAGALAVAMLLIYVLRHHVIAMLYTGEFMAMEELFLPQLIGDYFRALSYVIGYLAVAKAMGKVYVAAELYQAGILLLLSALLLPHWGGQAVPYAHALGYFSYLLISAIGLTWYLRRG